MIMVATRMLNSTIQENRGKDMTAAKKTKQNKKKHGYVRPVDSQRAKPFLGFLYL